MADKGSPDKIERNDNVIPGNLPMTSPSCAPRPTYRFRDHALNTWHRSTTLYIVITVCSITWYSMLIYAPMFNETSNSQFRVDMVSAPDRKFEYMICFIIACIR